MQALGYSHPQVSRIQDHDQWPSEPLRGFSSPNPFSDPWSGTRSYDTVDPWAYQEGTSPTTTWSNPRHPFANQRQRQEGRSSHPNLSPDLLWSRGTLSPCFRHDHHIIKRYSNPPFSAGGWEIDRRHMIEVQFDQFGVASHCRSTWGRTEPWRADRYRFGTEEAYSKLQAEISMFLSRLGVNTNRGLPGSYQPFEPSWMYEDGYENGNGNSYGYQNLNHRFRSWSNPFSTPWNNFSNPSQDYF